MKNSDLSLFSHELFGNVRVIDENREPWFVATDVAKALGYARPHNAISRHCRKIETVKLNPVHLTAPRFREPSNEHYDDVNIIPESDLYRLIFRSNLPAAEKFVDWVTEEVLPAIRKTGSYVIGGPNDPVKKQFESLSLAQRNRVLRDHPDANFVPARIFAVKHMERIEGRYLLPAEVIFNRFENWRREVGMRSIVKEDPHQVGVSECELFYGCFQRSVYGLGMSGYRWYDEDMSFVEGIKGWCFADMKKPGGDTGLLRLMN